jgi:hypothetical protein
MNALLRLKDGAQKAHLNAIQISISSRLYCDVPNMLALNFDDLRNLIPKFDTTL